jgi:fumarate hydratase subunit beta
VYFSFSGGCAVLAAEQMQLVGVHYPDLGMAEAIWEISITDLPLIVGIDAHGADLFSEVMKKAEKRYAGLYSK